MFHVKHYGVVVIGGGHAGCEAALGSARMGVRTALVTMDATKIAEMSCNPSIGGVGKGQLVKELDALGGEMGKNADHTGIQFKRLNTRKGSAVQSSRCQSDKKLYAERMQGVIARCPNLEVLEGEVKALVVDGGHVHGLRVLRKGAMTPDEIVTSNVVITAGTFMKAVMHCGFDTSPGGRHGERPSLGLSDSLRDLGFPILRLKTGTPARLRAASIDFSQMDLQPGDEPPARFSFSATTIDLPQVPCYLTYTNPETHEVIRKNLDRSPLYSGQIRGIGPRYCPSIEDKVVKFPEKTRHQLFFEPESLSSDWIYPNGLSTSLPPDVQEAFLRTIPGCRDVEFVRHGYAVEYDCVDPRSLGPTFETKGVGGLFLAGQVNGTSGYEEAAIQGLMAGINAALKVQGKPPFTLSRAEAYLGVLIDDLTSLGVTEPYRMFTSRAEFRLSLREDNADARLRPHGIRLGLVSDEDRLRFEIKRNAIEEGKRQLSRLVAKPNDALKAGFLERGATPLESPCSLLQVLKRPEIGLYDIEQMFHVELSVSGSPEAKETLEIEVKYEGYIALQRVETERLQKLRETEIPAALDFSGVVGLSTEVRQKLETLRPRTLAEAARIQGVTPAALNALLFHIRKKGIASADATL